MSSGAVSPYRRGRVGRALHVVGHHLTLALAWTVAHVARPTAAPGANSLPSVVRFVPHRATSYVPTTAITGARMDRAGAGSTPGIADCGGYSARSRTRASGL